MRELLVEIAAQPIEFFRLAQVLGGNRLVVFGDEGPIVRPARLVLAVAARTTRFGGRLGVAHLGVIRHLGGERLGRFGCGIGHVLARHIGFIHPRLRVLGVGALPVLAGLFLAAVLLSLVAFLLVRFGAAVLAHVESVEQIVNGVAETCLVFDQPLEPIEVASGAIFDQRPPQIDKLPRRCRRRLAGQSLSHHHRDSFLDRRIRPVRDLVEFAAMKSIVEHGREVLGNARHAACADRLDAGLLDCLEYGARLLPARHELAMHHGVVAGELECDRVGVTADDCRIRAADVPRQKQLRARACGRSRADIP
jgi:hypothetical protein